MARTGKTTVELRQPLLDAARELAARDGTSLRALIEEGLEHAIAARRGRKPFKLRAAGFRGRGLRAGVDEGDWKAIRSIIYEARGG